MRSASWTNQGLFAIVALAACGNLPLLHAGTAPFETCKDELGLTDQSVEDACSQYCTGSNFTLTGDGSCTYTITADPVAPGDWELHDSDTVPHDCCGTLNCSEPNYSLTVTGSSTASVQVGFAYKISANVAVEAKAALLGKVSGGLTTEANFSTSASYSSTAEKSKTVGFTANTPDCGKKVWYLAMFNGTRGATGEIHLKYTGVCSGTSCTPNPSPVVTFGEKSEGISLDGAEKNVTSITECDVACPGPYPVEDGCQSSGTTTQPCDPWTPPDPPSAT